MGKNQHSKDRLFLTATEHKSGEHRGSGKQSGLNLPYRTLPYDCCAISFRPFETPLATADGSVFELLNIVPYLKKFRKHPVTGEPLAASDLIKLHFHKNQEGQYACPVLYKPFTQHTHIVAIRPTGHVYCYDAVKQMNLKPGHLKDLLDETPFTRADIVTIQDPSDSNKREMEKFSHVREGLQVELKNEGNVRHNEATSRIMQQMAASKADGGGSSESYVAKPAKPPKAAKPSTSAIGTSQIAGGGSSGVPAARWTQTTGAASQSLTSTAVPVETVNEIAALSQEEALRQRHAFVKARKEKGYAQIRFSGEHGLLNLELHCDVAPMACENFLIHLESGYYDRTPVHRLIKNFMVQCGDPTGTGTGGQSAFPGGRPFKDEISNRFRHEGAGVLSMANSGPDTNGSQFFITFKSASHLDGKHTIFGRVVGGLEALTKLERLQTDKEDKPVQPLSIVGGAVFVNPFKDVEAKMAEAEMRKAAPDGALEHERASKKATDEEAWFNNDRPKPTVHRPGIGKYIAPQHLSEDKQQQQAATAAAAAAAFAAAAPPEPPKKRPKTGGFGSFSGW